MVPQLPQNYKYGYLARILNGVINVKEKTDLPDRFIISCITQKIYLVGFILLLDKTKLRIRDKVEQSYLQLL